MYCKKHGTIYSVKCYGCIKDKLNKNIDWNKIKEI